MEKSEFYLPALSRRKLLSGFLAAITSRAVFSQTTISARTHSPGKVSDIKTEHTASTLYQETEHIRKYYQTVS